MKHADLARANFEQADGAPTAEWKVTMYFYSAVHVANHARFKTSKAPDTFDHRQRRTWIRTNWSMSDFADYAALEDLSRIARYKPHEHPMDAEMLREAKTYAEGILKRL